MHPQVRLSLFTALLVVFALLPSIAAADGDQPRTVASVEFLGSVEIATGTDYAGTEIGGLSSITYDASRDTYFALSDDQGNRDTGDPVRFYEVDIDISDGSLDDGDVAFTGVTELYNERRTPFAPAAWIQRDSSSAQAETST